MIQGMKRIFLGLALAASGATAANADQLLVSFDFRVDANVDYQTQITPVLGGPVFVNQIRTVAYGNYCYLYLSGLHFSQANRGPLYSVNPLPGGIFTVNSQMAELQLLFSQTRFSDVNCRIELWSMNGNNPNPPAGDLVSRATMLSTDANLLSISVKMTNGYQTLAPEVSSVSDYARYFLDGVKANQSTSRLKEMYTELKARTATFEAAFLKVHSQQRNQDVGDSWQTYLKSLDAVRL